MFKIVLFLCDQGQSMVLVFSWIPFHFHCVTLRWEWLVSAFMWASPISDTILHADGWSKHNQSIILGKHDLHYGMILDLHQSARHVRDKCSCHLHLYFCSQFQYRPFADLGQLPLVVADRCTCCSPSLLDSWSQGWSHLPVYSTRHPHLQ